MAGDLVRRQAALVVEAALGAVFDPDVVAGLREDSPLTALGMSDADGVCVADAVAAAAAAAGWECVLGDGSMSGAETVAVLIDEVLHCALEADAGLVARGDLAHGEFSEWAGEGRS